jgi:hypothetical protein
MAGPSRIIKLSKNLKPFVSRVVRDGQIQRNFADLIGRPVGACVRAGVHAGMSGAQIHKVASDCAKQVKGSHIGGRVAGPGRYSRPSYQLREPDFD